MQKSQHCLETCEIESVNFTWARREKRKPWPSRRATEVDFELFFPLFLFLSVDSTLSDESSLAGKDVILMIFLYAKNTETENGNWNKSKLDFLWHVFALPLPHQAQLSSQHESCGWMCRLNWAKRERETFPSSVWVSRGASRAFSRIHRVVAASSLFFAPSRHVKSDRLLPMRPGSCGYEIESLKGMLFIRHIVLLFHSSQKEWNSNFSTLSSTFTSFTADVADDAAAAVRRHISGKSMEAERKTFSVCQYQLFSSSFFFLRLLLLC